MLLSASHVLARTTLNVPKVGDVPRRSCGVGSYVAHCGHVRYIPFPFPFITMAKKYRTLQKKRYTIGYARKSTDEKDKQLRSIPDQIQDIQKFYDALPPEEKMYPLKVLQETRSAFKPNQRPVFEDTMAMIDRGEVEALIVLDASRISRNPEDSGRFIQRLAGGQVDKVITINNGTRYSPKDTNQLFMLMLESAMSWKYSADNGTKVARALKKKVERGEIIGLAPLGYENRGEKGETYVVFDEERSPIVQHLFMLASTGSHSIDDLAQVAKKHGLKNRASKKRTETIISKTSIFNMLHNPFYKGYIRYKGDLYKGTKHEPLVEADVWERVQIQLASRCKSSPRSKKELLQSFFVMRGVLRCGKCKGALSFYQKKGKYVYAECKNKKTSCKNCINQKALLEQLDERLMLLELENGAEKLLRKDMQETHERETSQTLKQHKILEREYERVEEQIGDLFSQRTEAEKQGLLDSVDARLATLKMRKCELMQAIQETHDEGNEWIDHVLQCFELVKMAQEAIQYGSPAVRQAMFKAIASNYLVQEGELVWEPRSPFREKTSDPVCSKWGERWGLNPRPAGPQPAALTN
jgi:site-specific DNA recombinase